jgi:hypothetical protein
MTSEQMFRSKRVAADVAHPGLSQLTTCQKPGACNGGSGVFRRVLARLFRAFSIEAAGSSKVHLSMAYSAP